MLTKKLLLASCISIAFGLVSSKTCNTPFVKIGTQCLYIDTQTVGSFSEMKEKCASKAVGATLAKIPNASQFQLVIDTLMRLNSLTSDGLWIDGTDLEEEGKWIWGSGGGVPLGSPFWMYDCDEDYTQRPKNDISRNCLVIYRKRNYYFNDYDCLGPDNAMGFPAICEIP